MRIKVGSFTLFGCLGVIRKHPSQRAQSLFYSIAVVIRTKIIGAIINRLPLLRELNLREVVSAKMITGSLSSKHREVLDFPVMLHGLKQPFLEVGGGFENILNFFRIEGVYRVSPHKLQHAPRFEIKARFQVDF